MAKKTMLVIVAMGLVALILLLILANGISKMEWPEPDETNGSGAYLAPETVTEVAGSQPESMTPGLLRQVGMWKETL